LYKNITVVNTRTVLVFPDFYTPRIEKHLNTLRLL
jgi:DNA-binding sugar fermentation-stimulating protein